MDKPTLGLISIVLSAIGYGSYIKSVLDRKTRPHLFSWAVWSLLMSIVFLAQMSKGAAAGGWATGFSAAACVAIAVLSMRHGEKNITRGDWLAFAGALCALPVWYVTADPFWAVLVATAIDALAYYPTFRKSYDRPFEEHIFTYVMDMVKWIFALSALGDTSAASLLYPLFLMTANSGLVAMVLWRRRSSRQT